MVTDYIVVLGSASGPVVQYHPVLRLPGSEICDVDWGPVDTSMASVPTAVLTTTDGRQEVLDLGGRVAPDCAVQMVSYRRLLGASSTLSVCSPAAGVEDGHSTHIQY